MLLRTATALILSMVTLWGQSPSLTVPPVVAGCPGLLTLTGEPLAPFVLAVDSAPGPIFVPGLGLIELGLSSNFTILLDGTTAPIALDAGGQFQLRFTAPVLPLSSLPVTPLYAQALVLQAAGPVLSQGAALTITAGDTSFAAAPLALPTEALLAEDIAVVDVDQDGDSDLIIANSSSALPGGLVESVLLVNQGGLQGGIEGEFLDGTRAAFGAGLLLGALAVVAGDVDGDGDPDLIFGADDLGSNAPNQLWLNQGGLQGGASGTFVRDLGFPGGAFETQSLVLFDADGDGDLDLIFGNGVDRVNAPAPLEFYHNQGGVFLIDSGFFAASFNIGSETDDVIAADLDEDGDQDLVVVRDGVSIVLSNDGVGGFALVPSALGTAARNATAGLVADFNGDGLQDIFLSVIGSPDQLYFGNGTLGFSSAALPFAPSSPLHMDAAVADLDGDGDLDILVGTHALGGGELPFVYRNQGGLSGGVHGTFSAELLPAATSEIFTAVAVGDLDADGDVDLIFGSQGFFGPVAQDFVLRNQRHP